MARISTYANDDTLELNDKIIGTDTSSNSATMNFTLEQLGAFFSETGIAEAQVAFTFDVGGVYNSANDGLPNEIEDGHIYFNTAQGTALTEMIVPLETNSGVITLPFVTAIRDEVLIVSSSGDMRGSSYGFYDAEPDFDLTPVQLNGVNRGYRVPLAIHIAGASTANLPTEFCVLTPAGIAASDISIENRLRIDLANFPADQVIATEDAANFRDAIGIAAAQNQFADQQALEDFITDKPAFISDLGIREAEDQFADQDALEAFITDKEAFRTDIGASAWELSGGDEQGFIKPSTIGDAQDARLTGYAGGDTVAGVTAYRTTDTNGGDLIINIPENSGFIYNHAYLDASYWIVKRFDVDERIILQVNDDNIPDGIVAQNAAHTITIPAGPEIPTTNQRVLRYAASSPSVLTTVPTFGTMADPVAIELWSMTDVTRRNLVFGANTLDVLSVVDNDFTSLDTDGALTVSGLTVSEGSDSFDNVSNLTFVGQGVRITEPTDGNVTVTFVGTGGGAVEHITNADISSVPAGFTGLQQSRTFTLTPSWTEDGVVTNVVGTVTGPGIASTIATSGTGIPVTRVFARDETVTYTLTITADGADGAITPIVTTVAVTNNTIEPAEPAFNFGAITSVVPADDRINMYPTSNYFEQGDAYTAVVNFTRGAGGSYTAGEDPIPTSATIAATPSTTTDRTVAATQLYTGDGQNPDVTTTRNVTIPVRYSLRYGALSTTEITDRSTFAFDNTFTRTISNFVGDRRTIDFGNNNAPIGQMITMERADDEFLYIAYRDTHPDITGIIGNLMFDNIDLFERFTNTDGWVLWLQRAEDAASAAPQTFTLR